MSLFYRSRADERNMYGRLTVDGVLVVSYPVMAYSVLNVRSDSQVLVRSEKSKARVWNAGIAESLSFPTARSKLFF
jgi:hypothetical protein